MKNIQNIESAATADSLVLYWEKPMENEKTEVEYRIHLNDMEISRETKTHALLKGLQPDTMYKVTVEAWQTDTVSGTAIDAVSLNLQTGAMKRRLDVTQAPYFAKGDGSTMDTAAIQRAFSDCTPLDMVYFPKGIFLTGALWLHSDMEVYLEEGAVLQGTSDPRDYLPKIPSRFEGIEMECYSSLLNMGEHPISVPAVHPSYARRRRGHSSGLRKILFPIGRTAWPYG